MALNRGGEARARPKLQVGFVLMHNFTLTAFSTFVDVLRLAADVGDRSRPVDCKWQVMSPRRAPTRSSCGIEVQPSADLIDPREFDYLVVVGGLLHGAPALSNDIASYLRRAAAAGVTLVGVCTGSFVLCRLGLMEGRRCCVSWYHYRDFVDAFPALVPVADRMFVVDGDRITCPGGTGVADLAAKLVRDHVGSAQAQKALNILLIGRPRSGSDAQPAPHASRRCNDARVARALLLMEQDLFKPRSILSIAAELGMGVRQLERLFHEHLGESPQESYIALRLKHARWMLVHSRLSSSLIAAELGFSDCSHFGRCFKARYGMTPVRFRRRRIEHRAKPEGARPLREDNEDRRVFD